MIISWTKADGSKFMAKIDDTLEMSFMNFLSVNRAKPLTPEELKQLEPKKESVKIVDGGGGGSDLGLQNITVKKRWWRR